MQAVANLSHQEKKALIAALQNSMNGTEEFKSFRSVGEAVRYLKYVSEAVEKLDL
jgi:hypothetical protein